MLRLIPASYLLPWDYIYTNLLNVVPAGTAYFQQLTVLPYSDVKPTEFLVITDHFVTTKIYLNNQLIGSFVPTSGIFRLSISLNPPPLGNDLVADNGVDEPAIFSCAATTHAGFYEAWAQELYQYLNYTIETYFNAMNSPWATFFVEYQLPWKHLLPDVVELRILAVKLAANCLFGEFGENGGVTDLISSFCLSTPAVIRGTNPELYQPDLFNPTLSGSDATGFEAHVWFMNKCLNRWLAFTTLLGNLDCFVVKRVSEDVVIFQLAGTDLYKQHLFDTTGTDCSVLSLIDFLGCLDRWSVTGDLVLRSYPSFCFFATPFDQVVMPPGIGGTFFDSGVAFDSVLSAAETVVVPAFPGPYTVTLIHHTLVPMPLGYGDADLFDVTASIVLTPEAPPAPPSGPGAVTVDPDGTLTFDAAQAGDTVTVQYRYHRTLDGRYDIDVLTDYWVGTGITHFDSGGCLDSYGNSHGQAWNNTDCCAQGPTTELLCTTRIECNTTAAVSPINPLFGGVPFGLLANETFNALYLI